MMVHNRKTNVMEAACNGCVVRLKTLKHEFEILRLDNARIMNIMPMNLVELVPISIK